MTFPKHTLHRPSHKTCPQPSATAPLERFLGHTVLELIVLPIDAALSQLFLSDGLRVAFGDRLEGGVIGHAGIPIAGAQSRCRLEVWGTNFRGH